MEFSITDDDLKRIEGWFEQYVATFRFEEPEHQGNIHLKVAHTRRVRQDAALIARGEGMGKSATTMAEAMALLHDVGRFRQYAEHKSFNDSMTVNHGELGAEIVQDSGVLQDLHDEDAEVLRDAVKYHNAFDLPGLENPATLYMLMFLRDADRLDILRVFCDLYEGGGAGESSVLTHDLADTPTYSPDMLNAVANGSPASFAYVMNLNDLRLMHLTWVYSLNFKTTFKLLLKRDLINRTARWLPEGTEVTGAIAAISAYARGEKRSGEG